MGARVSTSTSMYKTGDVVYTEIDTGLFAGLPLGTPVYIQHVDRTYMITMYTVIAKDKFIGNVPEYNLTVRRPRDLIFLEVK